MENLLELTSLIPSDDTTQSTVSTDTETQTLNANLTGERDQGLQFFPWDNPDNVISLETQFLGIKNITIFNVMGAICGVSLNVVNGTVFVRLGLKDRINLLLFFLACADCAVNVCTLLYVEYMTGEAHCPILTAVTDSGMTTIYAFTYVSGFVSTLIACDRCLCITSPFRARQLLRTSTTGVLVGLATALLVALHYFITEKYKIRCQYIPSVRTSVPVYFASQFYKDNALFVNILNVIVFGLALPLFFVTTTTITTIVTAVQLRKAASWRQSSAATVTVEDKELALTKMLVAVSTLFVVCNLPNIIVRLTPLFVPDFRVGGRYQNVLMLCISVLYSFNTINSTLNFFFYYKLGSKYRATLKAMCCRTAQRKRKQPLPSVSRQTADQNNA